MNIDFLAIISIFGILIYRIDILRKVCKNICIYFITWYVDIDLVTIKNIYLCVEKLFRIIIATFLVIQFLNWLLELVWERWLKNRKVVIVLKQVFLGICRIQVSHVVF